MKITFKSPEDTFKALVCEFCYHIVHIGKFYGSLTLFDVTHRLRLDFPTLNIGIELEKIRNCHMCHIWKTSFCTSKFWICHFSRIWVFFSLFACGASLKMSNQLQTIIFDHENEVYIPFFRKSIYQFLALNKSKISSITTNLFCPRLQVGLPLGYPILKGLVIQLSSE